MSNPIFREKIDVKSYNDVYVPTYCHHLRKLSFVDCVSFVTMRHYKVEKVFGFDKHFEEQGFEIVNSQPT